MGLNSSIFCHVQEILAVRGPQCMPYTAYASALLLLTAFLANLLLLIVFKGVVHYFWDPDDLRRFPAPSCAGYTNLWSAYHSRMLRRSRAVLKAHQQLGPIIRIQPKHISFADPRAVQDIYGHRSPIIKSVFYKTISGGDHESLNLLDRLDRAAATNETIDIRKWLNYLTFDVISAMAFSNDPDLLHRGEDEVMAESSDGKLYAVKPIRSFQNSTVHVAWLGHWPELLRITKPLTKWWPNSKSGDDFEALCVHQIRQRLQRPNVVASQEFPFGDFFQHLLVNSKGEDRGLPFGELVQEAAVFLSAGSDTTASAMTNILYLLLKHPQTLEKLRAELQKAFERENTAATGKQTGAERVVTYQQASAVKYLRACVDEGLRHLTPTSVGLQRMTPPEGAEIAGHWVKGGITVSVPTYTLHHDANLFPDPFSFKPERWLEGTPEERQNQRDFFIPFTLGRHSCIGRNIAFLEQYVILSTLVSQYDFEFAEEGFELTVLERINANPGPMPIKVKRRP